MDNMYDVVVIGGGAAGLTTAIYLSRARYRVVVVEKEHFGGQITITDEVVNYPGVESASGKQLSETMRRQAERFGAEFVMAEVEGLDFDGDVKTVRTSRGPLRCFGVVLATGANPRRVGFKGEEEFQGRGVAYCATCDGEFFTGKHVFVVGGGFAAAEEAVFLTRYARHVTILVRKPDFSCAVSIADTARKHEKITVLCNTEVEEVGGDTQLRFLRYRDKVTGEALEYRPPEGENFGVFVFAGYEPATSLVRGLAELDDRGYVIVDRAQCTSVPGLYAAGDVCVKGLRQVVTAVADGAIAATELEKYASTMQEKTGMRPVQPTPAGKAQAAAAALHAGKKNPSGGLFSEEMIVQLSTMFGKMERPLVLRLSLDERPVSAELQAYMNEMAGLTDKLRIETADTAEDFAPCVRVFLEDGADTGVAFHGVPGGHEFTSFALGLYNASGPGQKLDDDVLAQVRAIDKPLDMKLLVSLSCTMCPDTVQAAQRMATENPLIRAEAFDVNHFPALREKYNVMSVPCVVVNDKHVSFGRKNVRQLLEMIGQAS